MLTLIPLTLAQANEFVEKHHRHHQRVQGYKFSIGCESCGELVGVVIAGRPVSRYLDDGFTSGFRLQKSRPRSTGAAGIDKKRRCV